MGNCEDTRTAEAMELELVRFRSDALEELLAHSEPLYDWQRRVLRTIGRERRRRGGVRKRSNALHRMRGED